jgi:hypothetical protein
MRRDALQFAADLSQMTASQRLAAADKIEKRDKVARKALKLETERPPMAINLRLLASGSVASIEDASIEPADESSAIEDNARLLPAPGSDEPSEAEGATPPTQTPLP